MKCIYCKWNWGRGNALNDKRSKVGMGVASDPAYGNNSPLYGAMGFVRKSEKKSGLTRKKKTP